MPANLENSAVATELEKVSFPSNPKKKGNAKEYSEYHTISLILHASKVMLKILQVRLQRYVNCELPDVQAGFIKGRGTREHTANILWIIKKAREFQKNIYFCFIDYAKSLWLCGSQFIKLWKILKRGEYQTTQSAQWKICRQVKKQQLELNVEQWTGYKLGKEYIKAVYCQPAYLT